jgi:hypothetical protein
MRHRIVLLLESDLNLESVRLRETQKIDTADVESTTDRVRVMLHNIRQQEIYRCTASKSTEDGAALSSKVIPTILVNSPLFASYQGYTLWLLPTLYTSLRGPDYYDLHYGQGLCLG